MQMKTVRITYILVIIYDIAQCHNQVKYTVGEELSAFSFWREEGTGNWRKTARHGAS